MQTKDHTLLITGGGSGIGRGLAEAFHRRGNTVVVAGRDMDKLRATAAANPGMQTLALDVRDSASIARAAREATERFPALDVLLNNAGIMVHEDLTRAATDVAERTIETNLLGPIRLTAALLPHLLTRPDAAVLNVTSGLAFVPMPATPTYCATKAALHSWSLSLREQLRDTSVEVIELVPPYVRTHLTGEAHATDPRAMPLETYVRDTMALLDDTPASGEVIIEGVAPLRHAEARGTFAEAFAFLTRMGRERSS